MGLFDVFRLLLGGAVREGAEVRKQERLNFQAVNLGWAVYAAAADRRARGLEEDRDRMKDQLDEIVKAERECRRLLSDAGRSIGEAHGQIAALTARVSELERR